MQQLPLILYDINNSKIAYTSVSKSNCYFIRAFKNFNIEVISGNCSIYSVKNVNSELITLNGQSFSDNNSYTIYLESDCQIKCDDTVYNIFLRLDNVFDVSNEHYLDLLANNRMPSIDELKASVFSENKSELVKRLLIDLKSIIARRGTRSSVEKFFNFVGLAPETIQVFDEYIKPNNDGTFDSTITPNKATDFKSGHYHILYDNYAQTGFDSNNLPIRTLRYEDLEVFFETLKNAIALANKYFTLSEQEITFFGLNYSANMAKFPTVTSNMFKFYEDDVHKFQEDIHIDFIKYIDSETSFPLVRDNIQQQTILAKSEIKIFREIPTSNKEMFLIDEEIFDDTPISDFQDGKIQSAFGTITHVSITAPNKLVKVKIQNPLNELTTINIEEKLATQPLTFKLCNLSNGDFQAIIDVFDDYNIRERYTYKFKITGLANIDFEMVNSSVCNVEQNDITSEIDAPAVTNILDSTNIDNYILQQALVPMNLDEYYKQSNIGNPKYLVNKKQFIIPEINKNFSVNSITESMPVAYIDNWLNILSFKLDAGYSLKIRIENPETNEIDIIDYWMLRDYSVIYDRIFVTVMDIVENPLFPDTLTPFVFITTTETGIDITKFIDFVVIHVDSPSIAVQISTLNTFKNKAIPVNHDFPLFIRPSISLPDFHHYKSDEREIQSTFNRMAGTNHYLKLGDVVVCKFDKNLVVNPSNIMWRVVNSFTDEVLFSTTDETLKFRISEISSFDVYLNFNIGNERQNIIKKSLFSSFKIR